MRLSASQAPALYACRLQGQWMRLALQLRDRYSLDAPLFNSSLSSGSTSEADIAQAVAAAYGKQPHIACKDG